jgi:hypothetical protein
LTLIAALRRSTVPHDALSRLVVAALVVTFATACASAPPARPLPPPDASLTVAGFSIARDTFAFRNDIAAKNPDRDDLYAHYCFVLARSARQFFQFARFDPAAPRLDHAAYVERVRRVVAYAPWGAALPADDRVVIPGYPSLRAFSRAEESAVKEGLGGRLWTWVHWTNWRVALPVGHAHQMRVLDEIRRELAAGRLVQLLVTNWPIPELNHTVVAFASRPNGSTTELTIWDPNEPEGPGTITFDPSRGFWATRLYETRPGPIRVFRMYYSALL